MKKVIRAEELQKAVNDANALIDLHGIHYCFSVNKPLNGESYSLSHDDKIVFTGTKKEIYNFLRTFVKVIKGE